MHIDPQTPLSIRLEKTKAEHVLDWIQVAFRSLFILVFILLISSAFSEVETSENNFQAEYVDWDGNTVDANLQNLDKNIAIVPIRGMIGNKNMGLINGIDGTTSESVLLMLNDIASDESIKAVVLKIDTPGGTVFDSEKIAKKIEELKKIKPVYALLESMATSGGYYIASQCTKIFAYEETLTGSLGVILEIPNAKKLADKIGVEMIQITSVPMKSMGSPFHELDEESRKVFEILVQESHTKFVERIANGRNLEKEAVRKIADGRIYSGKQALELGLIDGTDAVESLKIELETAGLENANLLEFSIPRSPFEELFMPMGNTVKNLFKAQSSSPVLMWKLF